MDVSRVSVKGQVTIPISIHKKLGIKEGDKVVFIEKGDNIIIANSNQLAFEEFQQGMTGAAEQAGIMSEQDVVDLVNDIRYKMWVTQNDDHA